MAACVAHGGALASASCQPGHPSSSPSLPSLPSLPSPLSPSRNPYPSLLKASPLAHSRRPSDVARGAWQNPRRLRISARPLTSASAALAASPAPLGNDAEGWCVSDVSITEGPPASAPPPPQCSTADPSGATPLPALREPQAAWPRLAKVLPKLAAVAVALAVTGLLQPLTSLAHGSAASAAHSHSAASALQALDSANQWVHVIKAAWTGLVAGCLHTLTGPDHLAALAPLTIGRSRVESAAIGALWGCGHDAGQILFGVLFLLMKERLHLDSLRIWGPRIVGLTLIAIGVMGIYENQVGHGHSHEHGHGHGHSHSHSHGHSHSHEQLMPAVAGAGAVAGAAAGGSAGAGAAPGAMGTRKSSFNLATFFTGIVHGLQPDALLVVLPALAMPSRAAGAAFLALFLLGTVVAMGSYTAFIGSCSDALRDRVPGVTRNLSLVAAVMAIGLGVGMLVGEVFGLQLL